MFPFLDFAMQGMQNPDLLAMQMAQAGIGPQQAQIQLDQGIGQLANPMPQPGMAGEMAMTNPQIPPMEAGPQNQLAASDPSIFDRFMGTVRQKVQNPNALAAIAATGQRESGFSPSNAYRTWDDLGAPAGGIMSWRGPRLEKMLGGRDITQITPEDQAQFLLNEGQEMGYLDALNNAKSPQEAQQIMNSAWAFKGYNNPEHPETMARFEAANEFAKNFGDAGNVGSTIDFARADGSSNPTPPAPAGGGLMASGTSNTGATMSAGYPQQGQQQKSFGDKLAALGKAFTDKDGKSTLPAAQPKEKPPAISGPGPQVGGGFSRDPQAIQNLMMLLGAGQPGAAQIPSLAAMIAPK